MKRYTSLLSIALLSIIAFASCTKVIDVDLNNTDTKYVIEAVLTNQTGGCKVQITQTKNFDENNTFPGVTGAVVTITDNNNNSTTLSETSAGIYESAMLIGEQGKTYNLYVNINGQEFTSSSTVPQRVTLDSLTIVEQDFFGELYKLATLNFTDPLGVNNYYLFRQYRNGEHIKQIYARNDDYIDGRDVSTRLYIFDDGEEEDDNGDVIKTKPGDTLTVDFMCIDKNVYEYWYSLEQGAMGDSRSAAPANPVSNISGGALGYFSAHTMETKSIIVE